MKQGSPTQVQTLKTKNEEATQPFPFTGGFSALLISSKHDEK